MSKLRIGLIVEGPTDAIVLEAGLAGFLDDPFTSVTLQPELPPGATGAGWSGVFRWCRQMGAQGYPHLAENPTLANLDLVIIEIDADVARSTYASANIEDWQNQDLPCELPCPPASDTVNALHHVVYGWLSPSRPGNKAVICIPSKCIETWAAAALYGTNDSDLPADLECAYEIIAYLQAKPAANRLIKMHAGRPRKVPTQFRKAQPIITSQWDRVRHFCPQAARFQESVVNAIGRRDIS